METMKPAGLLLITALLIGSATERAERAVPSGSPEVIEVRSGSLTLRAQLWRPSGPGPFAAVLFNHGSYSSSDPVPPAAAGRIGPVFARHGYVFLWLHRQGTGLSRGQGVSDGDQMGRAQRSSGGVEARNRVQLELLEGEQLNEATAALRRLRARADVDRRRVGIVGHSFGGSLSLMMAAGDPEIRAVVSFGAAAGSWNQSPLLRERLLAAVDRLSVPVLFVHAENDYSTAPGRVLSEEMRRLGKPQVLKIYPPFGPDMRTGHNLVFGSVHTWEPDVFAFLDARLRQ